MEKTNGKKKCPHCGKFVKPDIVFCLWCGETISEISDTLDSENDTNSPVVESPEPQNTRKFVKKSSIDGLSDATNKPTTIPVDNSAKNAPPVNNSPIPVDDIPDDDDDIIDDDISDEEAEYRTMASQDDYDTEDDDDDDTEDDDFEDERDTDEEEEDDNDNNEYEEDEPDDDQAFFRALSGQGMASSSNHKVNKTSVANSINKLKTQGANVVSQTISTTKQLGNANDRKKSNEKSNVGKATANTSKQVSFNPNYDGYYNDLCDIVDAKIDSISKDRLIRTIALILILFVIVVAMMYYI